MLVLSVTTTWSPKSVSDTHTHTHTHRQTIDYCNTFACAEGQLLNITLFFVYSVNIMMLSRHAHNNAILMKCTCQVK